jgi:hypothetical protein
MVKFNIIIETAIETFLTNNFISLNWLYIAKSLIFNSFNEIRNYLILFFL